jgi:hypothetical protein
VLNDGFSRLGPQEIHAFITDYSKFEAGMISPSANSTLSLMIPLNSSIVVLAANHPGYFSAFR